MIFKGFGPDSGRVWVFGVGVLERFFERGEGVFGANKRVIYLLLVMNVDA